MKDTIRDCFNSISGLVLFLIVGRATAIVGGIMGLLGINEKPIMVIQFLFFIFAFVIIGAWVYDLGERYIGNNNE